MWALRRQVYEARCIGRYRLVSQLARGGMGEVWLAHHTTLRRDVAVKILRTDQSPQALRRFEREVRATAELTHPNTVRIFDYGATDDGLWYYAMELLQGEDLARSVQRSGPMSAQRSVNVMLQACGALAEAHTHGIVHRDVKPENIFLCLSAGVHDFVKVIDFGVAKRNDDGQATALTHAGRWVGTPAYLSPEVALGGQADARSDVYGLGGVLYYLLSGSAPFGDTPAAQLLAAHISKQPVPPSERLGGAIDAKLEALVMRCLAKDPAARYADAGELCTALMHCLTSKPALAS
jgi:serine/threonine-protein kinase